MFLKFGLLLFTNNNYVHAMDGSDTELLLLPKGSKCNSLSKHWWNPICAWKIFKVKKFKHVFTKKTWFVIFLFMFLKHGINFGLLLCTNYNAMPFHATALLLLQKATAAILCWSLAQKGIEGHINQICAQKKSKILKLV